MPSTPPKFPTTSVPSATPTSTSLSQRIALVTGAARGIGLAIAHQLASQGITTILLDANPQARQAFAQHYPLSSSQDLQQAVTSLQSRGYQAHGLEADLSQPQGIDQAFDALEKRWGKVDILVHNAGIGRLCSALHTSPALWRAHQQTIVDAAFFSAQRALPHMCQQRWGRIIHVASVAGIRGLAQACAYVSAKHALVGLTRALAAEFGQYGVCVNAVCPGTVDAPMAQNMAQDLATNFATSLAGTSETPQNMPPIGVAAERGSGHGEAAENAGNEENPPSNPPGNQADDTAKTQTAAKTHLLDFSARHTQKKPLTPQDIAQAVAWLAGEGAARIKGQCLALDDGWSMQA